MNLFAYFSMAFGIWMAWTLYADVTSKEPAAWRDYLTTVLIAIGSLSTVITAIRVLV